uniref:Polyisoprenoid-binding protein n=1 Tax=Eiseniibacteriota bacterium TaxID=2212470 RepID=A0A832MMW7_UNCEI
MRFLSTLLALAALAAAGPASAQPQTFEIDAVHSGVSFKIRHFFSKTPGRFDQMSGTIVYDEKNLAASSVQVTIPAATIDTDNERRDNHLKSADFFDVEKHPHITFKSTRVVPGATKGKFTIEGDLTMRGVTKKVVLNAEMLGMGAVTVGGRDMGFRAGFDATTTINRRDWGIVWNGTLDQKGVVIGDAMLGDEVEIELHVEAVRK